jgi:hypothetical protein
VQTETPHKKNLNNNQGTENYYTAEGQSCWTYTQEVGEEQGSDLYVSF